MFLYILLLQLIRDGDVPYLSLNKRLIEAHEQVVLINGTMGVLLTLRYFLSHKGNKNLTLMDNLCGIFVAL